MSTTSIPSSSESKKSIQNVVNMTTGYWTVSRGTANRTGYSCRECKKIILQGEPIYARDGRKMRFFYHEKCFSYDSDPRSQSKSSKDVYAKVIRDKAPTTKGRGKWSVQDYGYKG